MSLLDQFPLSPKQVRSIVESQRHRISILSGAVRSGKTIASLISFLITVAEAPPSGLLILSAKTLQTAERNLIEPMQDPALFGPIAAQVHHTRGSNTCTILGRTVHIIGAADARAESKLRGLTAYCILLDEAVLLPEDYVAQALARCSMPGAKLIMTTNPSGPRSWLRQKYILRAGELNLGHWHFTLDDNPFLDPAYVDALKRELTGVWYQRMILGRWVQAEGAVYQMFDEARHIVRGELPPLMFLPGAGVDVGSTNPFHAVMLGVTRDSRLIVTREWRYDSRKTMRTMTNAEYSRELRKWIGTDRPDWICVDPAAKDFRETLFRDGVSNVMAADNSVLDGIQLVSSLFATDRMVIHESCPELLDEVPGYIWNERSAEKGIDEPVKDGDHGLDGLRYVTKSTRTLWQPYVPVAA